ncbi:MAG TPA: hypothetical protein VIL32_06895, partial [Steroidobacteraceae bacterium]
MQKPPFRAEHVGSLLRPSSLIDARRAHQAGQLDSDALRAAEDNAIREIVRKQEDAGMRTVTDGELRRSSWHMDFLCRLGGVTPVRDSLKLQFHSESGDVEFTGSTAKVTGRLHLEKPVFGEDFTFLKSVTRRGVPKLTIPSPSMLHYRGGREAISFDAYPDIDEFWADLKRVYAAQI